MSKVIVTGFNPNEKGFLKIVGFLDNHETGGYTPFVSDNVAYDMTLATSMRQQVLDNAPARINEAITNMGFPAEATIVPSDIEYLV
jgi:hypothetical protein